MMVIARVKNCCTPKRKYLNQSARRAIYDRDHGICQLCGNATRFFRSAFDTPFDVGPRAGSADHLIPVSLGGTNDPSNLRWACRTCNCARGNRQ